LLKEEKKKRIDMLQQLALNNAKNYPNIKSNKNLLFMCSLFIELTNLGGSIPEQLQSLVADSLENGELVPNIPKKKGRPEDWQTSYEVCEQLLKMIVESKEELSLNKHVDTLAEKSPLSSTAIYKIIKRHGSMFACIHLDFLETIKGSIPENVRNVIETVFWTEEDKEDKLFEDNKDFATSNPNSIKNKRKSTK
jgi:hypothetical protein